MPLSAGKYLTEIRSTINGWLYPGAVEVSEVLLAAQKTMNVTGGGIEIGVYQGAYLSYLAAATEYTWAGLDVFMFGQQDLARENIDRVLKEGKTKSSVELIQVNTQTLTEDTFATTLKKAGIDKIAFASIDGDHSAGGVFHDLKLVESRLVPGGIISVDDVLSPSSASVTEGLMRYMFGETSLRPVIFSDNKLFLTTTGFDELYRIKCQVAFETAPGLTGDRWRAPGQINKIRPFLGGSLMHI